MKPQFKIHHDNIHGEFIKKKSLPRIAWLSKFQIVNFPILQKKKNNFRLDESVNMDGIMVG